jgi:molybdate transport system substrate-binding protein
VIARGELDIGFQQMSELLPVAGVTVVGPLPEGAQRETVFSPGVVAARETPTAREPSSDTTRRVADAIQAAGLEPLTVR